MKITADARQQALAYFFAKVVDPLGYKFTPDQDLVDFCLEQEVMLEQTKALWFQAISDARPDPSREQVMRAWAAQFTVMENANALCALAIRTCGGQSMLKTLPIERMYRDSRCGSLMLPWTAELCLDRIGREALYETGETDD